MPAMRRPHTNFNIESRSTRYQQEAERCRRLAAKAIDAVERDTLLRIADEWMKLVSER
jgi:hypothetical protein